MPTTRKQRSTFLFWLALAVAVYVLASASIAVATADDCNGTFRAERTWVAFPPHWECR